MGIRKRAVEAVVNPDRWKGKRVFLTGHTGFKGGWLALWLDRLGAEVHGYALDPLPGPGFFEKAEIPGERHARGS